MAKMAGQLVEGRRRWPLIYLPTPSNNPLKTLPDDAHRSSPVEVMDEELEHLNMTLWHLLQEDITDSAPPCVSVLVVCEKTVIFYDFFTGKSSYNEAY